MMPETDTDHDAESSSRGDTSDKDHMSITGMSSQDDESTTREDDAKRNVARSLGFTETEQKIVNCSRFTFLFCLVASAGALAAAVYYVGRGDENGDFKGEVRVEERCVLYCHFPRSNSPFYIRYVARSSKSWLMISWTSRMETSIDLSICCIACRSLQLPS